MSLERNMNKLLRGLYERDKDDSELWCTGPEIQENLRLSIPDMNDAVSILSEYSET